ncbi:MAG: hypothetical protein JXB49_04600 [Bacteroidales bacterium]|nr:hypothetical protein [Bacteroidales bacterium]
MATQKQNSTQYFRSLSIIYFAMIGGQAGLSAAAYYLNTFTGYTPDDTLRDIFLYVVPVFIFMGIIIGWIKYKNSLRNIKNNNNLVQKMAEYRGALLVRLSFLQGNSFFAIVVYLITGDLIFLAMAGIIFIFFIYLKSMKGKIIAELELGPSDQSKIDDDNEIIAGF